MKKHRCEGAVIKEVRGQNKNVRCDAKATTKRELPTATGKAKEFHYCKKCADIWDRQQALIANAVG